MKENIIKKGVKFITNKTYDDNNTYLEGKVVYVDDEILFGKVILDTKSVFYGGGYFITDGKYIYEYITYDRLGSIFDIDNRCIINSISELNNKKSNHQLKRIK